MCVCVYSHSLVHSVYMLAGRMSRLKEEVVWVDTEQSCTVQLTDIKETATPTSPVKEGKNESDAALTACTFGFQGEIVKSEEMSMVRHYCM